MARSVHKLADIEVPHQIIDDLNKELTLQPGPIAQPTTVPGSAESRQVSNRVAQRDKPALMHGRMPFHWQLTSDRRHDLGQARSFTC